MKGLLNVLKKAHKALFKAKIDHALIGGLALSNAGIHRATRDVDMLVDGSKRDVAKQALLNTGFKLCAETTEVMHFTGETDLDLLLANRPLSKEMLQRARPMPQLDINCAVPEDIIGLKIQAYVNNPKRALQDKADIFALIEKNPNLDWEQIKLYADLFDEWPTLEAMRQDNEARQ